MEDVRVLRCYTAPGEAFSSEEEMKAHYRTELHRFNLKRKVAGLAPLTRAQYEVGAAARGRRRPVRHDRRCVPLQDWPPPRPSRRSARLAPLARLRPLRRSS